MNTKIQKEYVDMGFGFPVYLQNVPMVKVRGVWTPKVNYKKLSEEVLKKLVFKDSRLTGNELKFIRQKFGKTLVEFGEMFYVTHPAVLKWEKQGDDFTNMNWVTEKDIRLSAFLLVSSKEELYEAYSELREERPNKTRRTKLDLKEESKVLV